MSGLEKLQNFYRRPADVSNCSVARWQGYVNSKRVHLENRFGDATLFSSFACVDWGMLSECTGWCSARNVRDTTAGDVESGEAAGRAMVDGLTEYADVITVCNINNTAGQLRPCN